jgi:DNA-binding response OmpR family regulator
MAAARILIVDDDSSIRTSVRLCLEAAGYLVEQATHGADALEFIHRIMPELVLLDLAMPVMDGMTLLAEIRLLLPHQRPRVVVMTAHGSVKAAIESARLGASDFLEKPFTPDDLRQSVASVLHSENLPNLPAPGGGYGEVLQRVRKALRAGEFREAEKDLMTAGLISDDDPAFLNLAGVLHESHGRIESASKFYQKALAKSRAYVPAQENLRRLGEVRRNGKSNRRVAFGDEKAVPAGNWKPMV